MPERNPSRFSEESGAEAVLEIQPLLELQASLDAQMKAEILELSDASAENMQELRDEAYHDLYIDTPAKELLWQSERQLVSKFKAVKVPEVIAQIEIVEGYAVIQPDEAFRVLTEIGADTIDSPDLLEAGRIEALAKLGRYTDKSFVRKASVAAKGLEQQSRRRMFYRDIFTSIATAGDEESLAIAHRITVEELEYFTEYEDQVDSNRALIRLAALGFIPALDKAKATALKLEKQGLGRGGHQGYHYYISHYVKKDIATLVWIENEIKAGNIASICPEGYKLSDEGSKALEEEWRELVNSSVEEIVQHIKEQPHLPRELGRFGIQINGMIYKLEGSSSTHRDPEAIQEYVNTTTDEYASVLYEQGASALPRLIARTKDTHRHSWTEYYENQEPPVPHRESDPHGLLLGFWDHDKDDRLAREKYNPKPIYIESVHQLNLLCLARAVKLAAIASA